MNEAKFYQLVGANIAKVRLDAGIKQEELGNFLELTRASVVNIEKGRQKPSVYTLSSIAKYLGVDLEQLLPKLENEDVSVRENATFYGGVDAKSINQDSIRNFVELTRIL